MIYNKKKRAGLQQRSWFTDHLWQPLKGPLCAIQTLLLLPLLSPSPDGMWTFMTWPRYLFEWLYPPMMLVGSLLPAFIFWRHYDDVDRISYILFAREQDPEPLTARSTWRFSAVWSALPIGTGAAYYVSKILTMLSLPDRFLMPVTIAAAYGLTLGMQ